MNEQILKRKEYQSWDEAFRALAPVIRQQSVRVAAYTQVLFVQACASSFGEQTPEGAVRMKGEYADLAYKCGMYHQLGKALVPAEYQTWSPSFTEEEQILYRKYTADGRLLVSRLQNQGSGLLGSLGKRRETDREVPTKNISWLMLREACEQHMERFDGLGYPDGRKGNEISVIAQIVGLAKELDRLASETRSEQPFDEAYAALVAQSGKAFAPDLIEILKAASGKCRSVYKKYIHFTLTLPKTIPLVEKRAERPMGLLYRPMVNGNTEQPIAYEAVPWFGGVLGDDEKKESLAELEPMLERTELIYDMTFYLLYEAADTLLRMQNCKLQTEGILVPVPGSFYKGESQWERLEKLFKDQPVDMSKLKLTVPETLLIERDEEAKKNLTQYIEKGMCLVVDDYHPEEQLFKEIQEIGFTYMRPAPELYKKQETANHMTVLKKQGMTLLGAAADNLETLAWMAESGISYASGTITGLVVTEEELIRDRLLSERES